MAEEWMEIRNDTIRIYSPTIFSNIIIKNSSNTHCQCNEFPIVVLEKIIGIRIVSFLNSIYSSTFVNSEIVETINKLLTSIRYKLLFTLEFILFNINSKNYSHAKL